MRHVFVRKGISFAEVVGIFALVSILCGAITPHLINVREATQLTKMRFNLQKLRKRIEDYRNRQGQPPADLQEVFADNPSVKLPENPVSKSFVGAKNRVKKIDSDPPQLRHVTKSGRGGWLYNPHTGGIWPDHHQFVTE